MTTEPDCPSHTEARERLEATADAADQAFIIRRRAQQGGQPFEFDRELFEAAWPGVSLDEVLRRVEAAERALTHPAGEAGEGWPTDAMIEAGVEAWHTSPTTPLDDTVARVFSAMWAPAPKPQPAPTEATQGQVDCAYCFGKGCAACGNIGTITYDLPAPTVGREEVARRAERIIRWVYQHGAEWGGHKHDVTEPAVIYEKAKAELLEIFSPTERTDWAAHGVSHHHEHLRNASPTERADPGAGERDALDDEIEDAFAEGFADGYLCGREEPDTDAPLKPHQDAINEAFSESKALKRIMAREDATTPSPASTSSGEVPSADWFLAEARKLGVAYDEDRVRSLALDARTIARAALTTPSPPGAPEGWRGAVAAAFDQLDADMGAPSWSYAINRAREAVTEALAALTSSSATGGEEAERLREALDEVERAHPGAFWLLGKGRLTASEPLFGFQVMFGEEIIAQGEAETPDQAIRAALKDNGHV